LDIGVLVYSSSVDGWLALQAFSNGWRILMGLHTPAYSATTEAILPDALYPISAFIRASGVSKTRIREARLMGDPLPTLEYGKRLFVKGDSGIEWILRRAEAGQVH
jgi:hypothetical protein